MDELCDVAGKATDRPRALAWQRNRLMLETDDDRTWFLLGFDNVAAEALQASPPEHGTEDGHG